MTGSQSTPPLSLRIVAGLFVAGAVLSVAGIILALLEPRLNINLGVLGFWIAPGLLRGDRTWRGWAIALSAIGTIAAVIAARVLQRFYPQTVAEPAVRP